MLDILIILLIKWHYQNKLSNNVNDVNNMYNIKVGPEYTSDAVSTNSVVISIHLHVLHK